jgi:hypothetical protein
MKLIIIACEILYREISFCVSRSRNIVDTRFLRKGLHDVGEEEMSRTLRDEVSNVTKGKYEAVLLGYGLCSNGIRGLTAGEVPLVAPKAHDCITLLLGSKEKYRDHFDKHPGTYFRSTGWMERNISGDGTDADAKRFSNQLGFGRSYEDLVAKYGEDNARYVAEVLGDWSDNYNTLGYIDMGISDFPDYEEESRQEAQEKGWEFNMLNGDIGLLQRLVDGEWDPEEFLVVKPGETIVPTYVDDIIKCRSVSE